MIDEAGITPYMYMDVRLHIIAVRPVFRSTGKPRHSLLFTYRCPEQRVDEPATLPHPHAQTHQLHRLCLKLFLNLTLLPFRHSSIELHTLVTIINITLTSHNIPATSDTPCSDSPLSAALCSPSSAHAPAYTSEQARHTLSCASCNAPFGSLCYSTGRCGIYCIALASLGLCCIAHMLAVIGKLLLRKTLSGFLIEIIRRFFIDSVGSKFGTGCARSR
jgi:hypothetical protein